MNFLRFKIKSMVVTLAILLLVVGVSWADRDGHHGHRNHGPGHHYAPPPPHGYAHRPPPPPTYYPRHHHGHGAVYLYAPPPPPVRVYVPTVPYYPAYPPVYGGHFSASIGVPGLSFGFSIGN